jgi:hypothetical protein
MVNIAMSFDLATTIQAILTTSAAICAASVSVVCLLRWRRATGYKSVVHLLFAFAAMLAAVLNFKLLLASSASMAWPVALAYVGFATLVFVPAARVLGSLR